MICYDVRDNRRRRKVANVLLDYGSRVQYSGFECNLTPDRLSDLLRRAVPLIESKTDSLRCYRVCAGCRKEGRMHRTERAIAIPKKLVI